MTTAVDTNVLLDVLIPGAPYGDSSERALLQALGEGAIVICEAVCAEVAAHFSEREELDRFLNDTGLRLEPSGVEALHAAGRAWREYLRRRPASLVCPSCGTDQDASCSECGARLHPRQHVVADFLIGAHASFHAGRLLTRDRGYYQTYFSELRLI
ncbi:MAG: type II toxin-antitoxin system VapC family toxin [Dehalococcoidia bacterium]|jgi:hypothetical protein|nr:type II toxin-antitoxin system VapC family toxin [Dehalococcoidia bacterium]